MMASTMQPATPDASSEDGTSYNVSRLIRVSTSAAVLSWLFAILGLVGLAWALYSLYTMVTGWGPYDTAAESLPSFLVIAFLLLQCFFFSIISRAVSESMFILRDIEENTRSHQ
jgi:hypothetical protein